MRLPNFLAHNERFSVDEFDEFDPSAILGRKIGVGSVKTCYLHKDHPDRCIKTAQIANARQMAREVNYFHFLRDRGVVSDCVPAFHGAFRWGDHIGFVQECFLTKEQGGAFDRVRFLGDVINDPAYDREKLRADIRALKTELIRKNIIAMDLHGGNIVFAERDGKERIVIIDGLGTPEAVPAPQYIRLLGRLKTERKWKDFLNRYPQLKTGN